MKYAKCKMRKSPPIPVATLSTIWQTLIGGSDAYVGHVRSSFSKEILMNLMTSGFAVCTLLLTGSHALAGEFNEVLSIGDKAPAWKELPGTDGKQHSLADLKDKKYVVVVFTCASCPTAVEYEERISRLTAEYADKSVAVVPICVNRVKQDRLDALSERVKKQELGFHYVYDESQQIAKDYGANITPEFFVLDANRQVIYMGALDDEATADKVKEKWVEQAIDAASAGKKPGTAETIARGCRIRYERNRKAEK
jgi:peroxiredoxin